jgi:hypothetical protein
MKIASKRRSKGGSSRATFHANVSMPRAGPSVAPDRDREEGQLAAADVEDVDGALRHPLRVAPQQRLVPGPVAGVVLRHFLPTAAEDQIVERAVEARLIPTPHGHPCFQNAERTRQPA